MEMFKVFFFFSTVNVDGCFGSNFVAKTVKFIFHHLTSWRMQVIIQSAPIIVYKKNMVEYLTSTILFYWQSNSNFDGTFKCDISNWHHFRLKKNPISMICSTFDLFADNVSRIRFGHVNKIFVQQCAVICADKIRKMAVVNAKINGIQSKWKANSQYYAE